MADGGISYAIDFKTDLGELDKTISKLDSISGILKSLDEGLLKTDSLFKDLDHATDKAGAASRRHVHDLKSHEEGLVGVGHAIGEAKLGLKEFAEFTGLGLLAEGLEGLIDKAAEFGKEMLKAAANSERLDLALKLNVGEKAGKELSDWDDRMAPKTRFTDDTLKAWDAKFLARGVKRDQLKYYRAAALDVDAMSPGSAEMAVEAMSRAATTGKIGTRQLVEMNVPVPMLKQLPEYKGLSDKEFNKKLDTGALSMPEVFQVLAGPGHALGEKGFRAAQDMGTKLKNVGSLKDQYAQRFAETRAYQHLKNGLDKVYNGFAPDSEVESEMPVIPYSFGSFGLGQTVNKQGFRSESKADDLSKVDVLSDLNTVRDSIFLMGKDIGVDLAAGMKVGIEEGRGGVKDSAAALGKGAIGATKMELDSHSPSRVFMGIGKSAADGFILGIDGGRRGVDDALKDLGSLSIMPSDLDARANLETAAWFINAENELGPRPSSVPDFGSPFMGGGDISVSIDIGDIIVKSADGESEDSAAEAGRAIANQLSVVVESTLIDLFERLNTAEGSAA